MVNLANFQQGYVCLSSLDGLANTCWFDGEGLHVKQQDKTVQVWQWSLTEDALFLQLQASNTQHQQTQLQAALSAIEALFAADTQCQSLVITAAAPLLTALSVFPFVTAVEGGQARINAPQFYQHASAWLTIAPQTPSVPQMSPVDDVAIMGLTQGEWVYQRHIPWLDQRLGFRVVDLERDLAHFHQWQNNERVAYFWEENGSVDKHRAYLQKQLQSRHQVPLIGTFDGEPFGYFEIYWAVQDRIAPYYNVQPLDQGWHMLVGNENYRGKAYFSAWCPSIMHLLFLRNQNTQTLVCEPRADHARMIANLEKSGMTKIKEFDFPHKTAALMMIQRDDFFAQQRYTQSV